MDFKKYIFSYCPACDEPLVASAMKGDFECKKCGAPLKIGRSWPKTIGYGIFTLIIMAFIPGGSPEGTAGRNLGLALVSGFFGGRVAARRKTLEAPKNYSPPQNNTPTSGEQTTQEDRKGWMKRIIFGVIWLFVFFALSVFGAGFTIGIYGSAAGVDPYEIGRVYSEKYLDIALIGSLVISVAGTIAGILPGTGNNLPKN